MERSIQAVSRHTLLNEDKARCALGVGAYMWVGCKGGLILILTLENHSNSKQVRVVSSMHSHKTDVQFLVDTGSTVWSCSRDGQICVWHPLQAGTYTLVYHWFPLDSMVCPSCLHVVESESALATVQKSVWVASGAEGTITVWDVDSYSCVASITDQALLECAWAINRAHHV